MKFKLITICILLSVYSISCKKDKGETPNETIIEITEVISNGSFEIINESNKLPSEWNFYGENSMSIDTIVKQNLDKSLKIYEDCVTVVGNLQISQLISGEKITQGESYTLNFWMKNKQMTDRHLFWINILQGTDNTQILYQNLHGPRDSLNWTYYSIPFIPENNESTASYTLTFDFQNDYGSTLPLCIWLDNISISKE